ncbi:MAG TPA: hypothetical protein VNG31_10185, partial [Candidatus Baltobacteraceae bacterium]|nr:hypothetical protein [Candidatus Baltobacteraceae bacterium]
MACLVALSGAVPALGAAPTDNDRAQALALLLFNRAGCARHYAAAPSRPVTVAQATPEETPSPIFSSTPGPSPSPVTTPGLPGTIPGAANGTYQLYATPRPQPGASGPVTPPPVPTPTPNASAPPVTIFLQRGGETPPPISPAGQATPSPTPEPTGVPTLAPGYVAIISDTVSGGTKKGQPGDAVGNVHIYYSDEEIVGDRAHYDGQRTITITGHPFLINHQHNSILTADQISFDTVAETAKLVKGNGESAEGVERGFLHFRATDLHTDPDGTAHGIDPYVTTCENPRGGYHITGKTIDVVPG